MKTVVQVRITVPTPNVGLALTHIGVPTAMYSDGADYILDYDVKSTEELDQVTDGLSLVNIAMASEMALDTGLPMVPVEVPRGWRIVERGCER